MKRKIFSFLSCAAVLIACFTVSVFATEVLSEEKPWEDIEDYYGDSKESSSNGDHSSCSTDCDYCRGYDAGYYDGAHAGYEYFKNNVLPELIDKAIADYKNTDEYKAEFDEAVLLKYEENKAEFANALIDAKADAVDDYKKSQEYKDALAAERTAGEQAGLEVGYLNGFDSGNKSGYADGYSSGKYEFRTSEAYKKELQENANAGYSQGFLDGHAEGYNTGVGDKFSPSQLIALIITAIVLSILAIALTIVLIKKRKVKR